VAYALIGKLGLSLADPLDHTLPLAPAIGIALAALVRWGLGCWPGVALGALWLTLDSGLALGPALGTAAGETLGPCLAAAALAHAGFDAQIQRRRDLGLLLALGALAAAVSALNASLWLAQWGVVAWSQLPKITL
jgi:hypothetical protein